MDGNTISLGIAGFLTGFASGLLAGAITMIVVMGHSSAMESITEYSASSRLIVTTSSQMP